MTSSSFPPPLMELVMAVVMAVGMTEMPVEMVVVGLFPKMAPDQEREKKCRPRSAQLPQSAAASMKPHHGPLSKEGWCCPFWSHSLAPPQV